MRKLFTLTALGLALCLNANAQVRKSWDFTKWSQTTLNNLEADMTLNGATSHWRDYEKSETEANRGRAYWCAATISTDEKGNALVYPDGTAQIIPELAQLNVKGMGAKNFVIVHNWGQKENASSPNGMYTYGKSFLWINGGKKKFIIPKVRKGETIKMGVESHKEAEGRGFTLSATGATITITKGNPTNPTVYNDCEWLVEDDTPDVEDSVDITLTTNNGCHIYYITVGEGDVPQTEEAKKIAYIYNGTGYSEDEDFPRIFLSGTDGIAMTNIDIADGAATVTADSLRKFDAVVISPFVAANDAYLPTLKKVIAYEPILNLNPDLYEGWGYGTSVKTSDQNIGIKDSTNALFVNTGVGFPLQWNEAGIKGVNLGEYFAADDTIATVTGGVAIHVHNARRNAYMLFPYAKEELATINADNMSVLLPEAVKEIAATKAKVTSVVKPVITETYSDNKTIVSIASGNKAAKIYYTTDGTEPTTESTLYTEPIAVTEAITLNAIAVADGYDASDIATLNITIKQQASQPTVNVESETGKSTIELTAAEEGVTIYYNFIGSNKIAQSKAYTAPIVVTEPVTITTFVSGGKYVDSELSSKYIDVKGVARRLDILAHFDANRKDWSQPEDATGSAKAVYLFSWGKTASSIYDTNIVDSIVHLKNAQGNDSIVTYYHMVAPETKTNGEWILSSCGQVVDWENTAFQTNVGDGSNYNPQAPEDMLMANDSIGITNYILNFGGKVEDEKYTATLTTSKAYAGPFDVVTYMANGNGSSIPEMEVEISEDGEKWTKLGDVKLSDTRRLWNRVKLSYESTTPVYVRLAHVGGGTKAMLFDMYLLNEGEHTKHASTGIADIVADNGNVVSTQIFNVNGIAQSALQPGLNIVRTVYSNGKVIVKKILVK